MVLDILKRCTVDGLVVKLPAEQLEKEVYEEVKKKLMLIGGKWKGGNTQGFVFEEDPTALLAEIADGGDRNLKKENQFFPTPKDIAEQMISYLPAVGPSMKILEPSAGDGSLIKAFRAAYPDIPVDCFELMELNRKKLAEIPGANIIGNDFIETVSIDTYNLVRGQYDIIIANPPFTKNQDIDHIMSMYECLKPGGTIITLASPSWTFGNQHKQVVFKEWLETHEVYPVTLPDKSFVRSGTGITPVLLQIQKPIANSRPAALDGGIKEVVIAAPEDLIQHSEEKTERFSDEELAEFKHLITEKLSKANDELKYLEDKVELMTKDADKKEYGQLAERQKTFIGHLNDALKRIDDKTYGFCRVTGKLIDKARLRAVPHATLSIEGKKQIVADGSKQENKPESSIGEQITEENNNYSDNEEKLNEGVKPTVDTDLQGRSIKDNVSVRICRVCGCTQDDCSQCIKKTGQPCHWVEDDLCSACQIPKPEAILDQMAENEKQIQEGLQNLRKLISSKNNNDMNFFQQLNTAAPGVDLTLRLKEKNGKYTMSILPNPDSKTSIQPLIVTGLPQELDEKFFELVGQPLLETSITLKNAEQHKESVAETVKKDNPSPAKKSVTATKKEEKKSGKKSNKKPAVPAVKKEAKKPVKKEPKKPEKKEPVKVVKEERIAEPDLFAVEQ